MIGVRRVQRRHLRSPADSGSRVLITMDGCYRGGELTAHKVKADEAVMVAGREGQEASKVLVWRRHPGQARWRWARPA